MFEYLSLNMLKDGTEQCIAYGSFALDKRGIYYGTTYRLENNHVKNNYKIEKWNSNNYIGIVATGKEETL